ncbi:fibronectin type III domain-containing protein [Kineosporia succinea]|uniref:Alpha-tubulin suppressor-like RCC1 family protein n=1 Tax=Kineosporia succinea TaxID=84632 RepID=A0ABT9P5X8_9ACTN|nr:fibronectin type III domain-containing protein [Kineosporia succinea]MDP9828097.1 alpha-tubulin suppressor-like RCC1 family protein [Kineosporia succinea]
MAFVTKTTQKAASTSSTYKSSGFLSDLFEAIKQAAEAAAQRAAEQAAAQAAAAQAAKLPAQVTGVDAVAGDAKLDLTWDVPSSKKAVTSYTLTYAASGQSARSKTVTGTRNSLTGLVNGTSYSVTVSATSSAGTGPASKTLTATPLTLASAPSGVSVDPGDGSFTASWKAPRQTGGAPVDGYVVTATPETGADVVRKLEGTDTTVTGLTNGKPYRVRVAAVTAAGTGAATDPVTATPLTVAQAPDDLAVDGGDGEFTAHWNAPAQTGGAPVTGYLLTYVTASGQEIVQRVADTQATVGGLTNGTAYQVSVAAITAAGTGVSSLVASVLPKPTVVPTPEPAEPAVPATSRSLVSAGWNGSGQLLTGATDTVAHPGLTGMLEKDNPLAPRTISDLSVGEYATCAVSEGTAYCWGTNPDGQLGNGSTASALSPTAVGGLLTGKTVTDVSAGVRQTCAVADGSAYCWGANSTGQLGNGTTTASTTPVRVAGLLDGKTVSSVSTQLGHTCALAEGKVYCWGDNKWGQLGNGSTTLSTLPVAVTTTGVLKDKTVTDLSTGYLHNCVIASGAAYCWGYNAYGGLGNFSTDTSSVPVAVNTTGVLKGRTVTGIDSRSYSSCAVADGAAYCWGYNGYGPLGTASTGNSAFPVAVDATGALKGKVITQVTTGYVASSPYSATGCALATDGTVACWGTTNTYGNLGNGTAAGSATPVAVPTGSELAGRTVTAISTNGRTTSLLTR